MVLMPMAEPDHLHPFIVSKTNESLPVGSRIDENARSFDVEGMAEGITAPVIARQETDWTKAALFHLKKT